VVAEPKTIETVVAEVKAGVSNFIPMVTNRMGTNFGPAAAEGLAILETNALTALTNSAVAEMSAAGKFLTELQKEGHLPGTPKGSHESFTTDTLSMAEFQEARYPFTVTFHLVLSGESFTNHYMVLRSLKDAPWQLRRAWRTDAQGRRVAEWPAK
jgi:hypothetical protein